MTSLPSRCPHFRQRSSARLEKANAGDGRQILPFLATCRDFATQRSQRLKFHSNFESQDNHFPIEFNFEAHFGSQNHISARKRERFIRPFLGATLIIPGHLRI
jgi:hypothetical protein